MSEKQYTMFFVGRVSDSVTREAEGDVVDWDVGLRCANPTYEIFMGFE